MEIDLIKLPKPKLQTPEFNCDNGIAPWLNNYEMLSHLNSFSFNGIIGRPGSGKTSMLISWLTGKKKARVFRRAFDNLILVMPTSSRASMKKNIFEKHSPDKMFDELTLETTNKIHQMLRTNTSNKESSLLILDDIGASLKNKEIQKLLREIIYNRRHMKTQIICLLQSYLSVPKEVRKLFSNLFIFKPSKVEFENLCDETLELKRDESLQLMRFVFDKPYVYLMINLESQKKYKNFDEIIITKPEDIESDIEK